jgi:hypothetical protein
MNTGISFLSNVDSGPNKLLTTLSALHYVSVSMGMYVEKRAIKEKFIDNFDRKVRWEETT